MKIIKWILGRITSKTILKGKNKIVFPGLKVCKYRIKLKSTKDINTLIVKENCRCNNLKIKVEGSNNFVQIGKNLNADKLLIEIKGNNNKVILDDNITIVEELKIYQNENADNRTIFINNLTSFYKTQVFNNDNQGEISIGKDCMFAYNTTIRNDDGHTIYDINTKEVLNSGKQMKIGNHVWICTNATILKNSEISDNSIIASNALVSGKYSENNVIIAGVGAKIIKHGINWDRLPVNEFMKNKQE